MNEHEMNPEEMKGVGGGVAIDWDARCSATVENGSSCWGTDACYTAMMHYYRDRSLYGCSATVESQRVCSNNDFCNLTEIRYALCSENWRSGAKTENDHRSH